MNDLLKLYLLRGIHQRCPQCGKSPVYRRWNILHERCPLCGFNIEEQAGDTWFFTYMSTAFLTGLIILFMLLFPPKNQFYGQIFIVLLWFIMIFLTLPFRKSIGVALNYYLEHRKAGTPDDPEISEKT